MYFLNLLSTFIIFQALTTPVFERDDLRRLCNEITLRIYKVSFASKMLQVCQTIDVSHSPQATVARFWWAIFFYVLKK